MIMKKILASLLCVLMVSGLAGAQDAPKPDNKIIRRIKIRSADPRLIALLLSGKGNFLTPPESSTILKLGGNNGLGGGNGGNQNGGGHGG
jgi:hypothetical protein